MNPSEVLRIVDTIHRDKHIDKDIVFDGIEAALLTAARKHYGDTDTIEIQINREDGSIVGVHNGSPIDPTDMVERIGAQTAKQVMIQKIREAERDVIYDEYVDQVNDMVTGSVNRDEGRLLTVTLSKIEAVLPRSEQIPRQRHRPGERVNAVICDVQKVGSRVRVVLSRTRPVFVQRLFEQEIPEISDGVIEIKALSREPGYRSKIAVTSSDQRIDCVGACVGVRGSRIRNIGQEIGDERIDIVRWSDDLLVFISNALQPAEVEEVILCGMLGRAIVLVREDQLSLAIGRKGQNVRLASKLVGWDIEIMTREQLEQQLEKALIGFIEVIGVSEELADRLIGEGFLTFDDLSIIEPEDLMEMGGLTMSQVEVITEKAEQLAEQEDERLAPPPRASAPVTEEPSVEETPEAEEEQQHEEAAAPEVTPESTGADAPVEADTVAMSDIAEEEKPATVAEGDESDASDEAAESQAEISEDETSSLPDENTTQDGSETSDPENP